MIFCHYERSEESSKRGKRTCKVAMQIEEDSSLRSE